MQVIVSERTGQAEDVYLAKAGVQRQGGEVHLIYMSSERIEKLTQQIADLKKRRTAHSVPPALMEQLDELEEELREELNKEGDLRNRASPL